MPIAITLDYWKALLIYRMGDSGNMNLSSDRALSAFREKVIAKFGEDAWNSQISLSRQGKPDRIVRTQGSDAPHVNKHGWMKLGKRKYWKPRVIKIHDTLLVVSSFVQDNIPHDADLATEAAGLKAAIEENWFAELVIDGSEHFIGEAMSFQITWLNQSLEKNVANEIYNRLLGGSDDHSYTKTDFGDLFAWNFSQSPFILANVSQETQKPKLDEFDDGLLAEVIHAKIKLNSAFRLYLPAKEKLKNQADEMRGKAVEPSMLKTDFSHEVSNWKWLVSTFYQDRAIMKPHFGNIVSIENALVERYCNAHTNVNVFQQEHRFARQVEADEGWISAVNDHTASAIEYQHQLQQARRGAHEKEREKVVGLIVTLLSILLCAIGAPDWFPEISKLTICVRGFIVGGIAISALVFVALAYFGVFWRVLAYFRQSKSESKP